MSQSAEKRNPRRLCAIYTRKSSEEGLEQSFNSLHAQREACEAYVQSQTHEGWIVSSTAYDDGGFSGGNVERPALNELIEEIKQGNVDVIVVYKVDRLSRSLADFVRLVDLFDQHSVSFVSVTQQFNTSSSMGRLTLNVLLSFAQFEREVTSERIRDKIAASKRKGMWMGGVVPLGYDVEEKQLVVNETEAETVRHIYERYLGLGCVRKLKAELDGAGIVSKRRVNQDKLTGGKSFSRGALYTLLKNPIYVGRVVHQGNSYDGQHKAILKLELWTQAQELLSANRHKRLNRVDAKVPSLLVGLLFDDNGNVMSPTHASKNGRRYRYYISQAIPQYREQESGSVTRIPAQTIEEIVTDRIKTLIQSPNELLTIFSSNKLSAIDQQKLLTKAKTVSNTWADQSLPQLQNYFKQWIKKITIGREEVNVVVSKMAFLMTLLPNGTQAVEVNDHCSDEHMMSIPVHLKRCGIETKLVIPNGESFSSAHQSSVTAIQNALAKALEWNQALIAGSVSSMAELARQNDVTQRYIAHLIKMAFLAPDIMMAIKQGKIPSGLSLGRVKKGFSMNWEEQRRVFGFKYQL
jgi:DNA invertase Pin-like site-specific DNA recombinase